MLCVPENHPNDQFPSDISNKQRLASLFLLLDSFFFFSTPDVPLKSRWPKNLGVDTPQPVYKTGKDPSELVAHLSNHQHLPALSHYGTGHRYLKTNCVVIAVIGNTVVWRAPDMVKSCGGSCGATCFRNTVTHG